MSAVTECSCRSPQEERIKNQIAGNENAFRHTHERVFRLLERFEGQIGRAHV